MTNMLCGPGGLFFIKNRKTALMKRIRKKKILPLILFLVVIGIGVYLIWGKQGTLFEVNSGAALLPDKTTATPNPDWSLSPISGLACADASRRPIAVMLSSDAVARPLSGISEADLVIEMPVITGSITRLMAVFVCGNPKEVGSIRSARHDFIPLARGLDAVYAHWGGSHFALDKLNAGIMDNIDALKNPFEAFYRKAGIAQPHNGFSSVSRLIGAAKKLGYRLENKFSGYPHLTQDVSQTNESKTLDIGFTGVYEVKYKYDPVKNSYLRWRGGAKEMDKITGEQVAAKNVVIMRVNSRQIEKDYNDVQVEGEGKAMVYRNGEEIIATWKKDAKDQTSKLFFYDEKGAEIEFVPGQVWIEIVEQGQSVTWQ